MPCKNINHAHVWVTEGELVIERCEKICYFCNKGFKHAWFLRRHVSNVHCKEYPMLTVNEGWTGSPNGNRRPHSPEKRGRHSRTPSTSSDGSDAEKRTEEYTPPNCVDGVFCDENMMQEDPFTENPFILDPNFDMDELMSMPLPTNLTALPTNSSALPTNSSALPTNLSAMTTFVTPQFVRINRQVIERVPPAVEHHAEAKSFAVGLNSIVQMVVSNGTMTPEEILYVLETFTDTFKIGLGFPM